ncbi:hypothetical protein JO84_gp031 [Aureococcus anophagefferens virus]|uniref:Uncharacterized protein n=1 Tax=Aureococcus anophagefferens virus TaxID=1474867 RepID=A0A076FHS1_9VIRU|nr:hypothetical protein JO84_gp031 [Aureococcus anophagefferens virus]AII16976.1 hypothetical protein AaV_031 [Aureococcus anophagefferens virus]UOG94333.1 hypothetical protein MKD35_298 [Aureococcus anophagefferens virus]
MKCICSFLFFVYDLYMNTDFQKVLKHIRNLGSQNKFRAYSKKVDKFKIINNTKFQRSTFILDFKQIYYIIDEYSIIP